MLYPQLNVVTHKNKNVIVYMITGMLVCRKTGNVLKPATKVILGEREIAFYENLKNSRNPTIVQLKKLVPCYYGTTELWVFNKRKYCLRK